MYNTPLLFFSGKLSVSCYCFYYRNHLLKFMSHENT
ncbi:hypothetical protein BACOVA_02528 [Bacteroides ovatus ATCC 8483]|uniref:Uncharacterized protein n=1 Tax=Bacteroides ovatus (strain ATCC 8483 / DSM 1896 / JCM 5824 / BCRC 10623 / CCUG 4943 / NCTC 11153) TaxID=411476 RepID=A0AAN3A8M0_BACO1|nr:hypothetical protein BACOVA_02528 [Bacteroides ovatus ATCC 8483]